MGNLQFQRVQSVNGGIGITVDRLNHHWDLSSSSWIIPELRNGHTRIIEDDVIVTGDTR